MIGAKAVDHLKPVGPPLPDPAGDPDFFEIGEITLPIEASSTTPLPCTGCG